MVDGSDAPWADARPASVGPAACRAQLQALGNFPEEVIGLADYLLWQVGTQLHTKVNLQAVPGSGLAVGVLSLTLVGSAVPPPLGVTA